jgi:hypothetical protein
VKVAPWRRGRLMMRNGVAEMVMRKTRSKEATK